MSAYDLKRVKAPIVKGRQLAALTAATESSLTGGSIIRKLLRDMGFEAFRAQSLSATPKYYPIGPKPEGDAPEQPALATLAELNPEVPGEAPTRAIDLHRAYAAKETTVVSVAERAIAALERDREGDQALTAVIAFDREKIRTQARESQARWDAGAPLGPLDGVPVLVKDELDVAGYPTTVGTSFLADGPAAHDATVVARLRAAGAVILGKANMHEIGIGITGFNARHGTPRNPYHLGHHTGGSSSGSAAAVGAGYCPIAVAADGGGSIRIPAAHCGMYGLKATYGRISEHGAAPLCWTVAHAGPIASSAADLALAYAVMAGEDAHDPMTQHQGPLRYDGLGDSLEGVRLGVYEAWFSDADDEIVAACRATLDALTAKGATIVPITIPRLDLVRVAHAVTIVSEMSAAVAPYYDKHRKDFGLDTRLNLALARSLRSEDYVRAQRARAEAMEIIAGVFAQADLIVTPTTGRTAPPIPEGALAYGQSDLGLLTDIMRFMTLGNLTGIPGLTVPVGYDAGGLPIGMQFMARHWEEHLLLRIAVQTEAALERRKPVAYTELLG